MLDAVFTFLEISVNGNIFMDKSSSRKTSKPASCPNPLFENWLTEWKEEAIKQNSELQYCYGKALKSLRKYPILLRSGKECLILQNFGVKLCDKLDRKLDEHRKKYPDFETVSKAKVQSPVPHHGSGAYAILLTLLQEQQKSSYPGYMNKNEIQEKAQSLCDNSFTKPAAGSYYTAWSSMSTLVKKRLIEKKGNPAKFSLTKEGEELAIKLCAVSVTDIDSPSVQSKNQFFRNKDATTSQNSPCKSEDFYLTQHDPINKNVIGRDKNGLKSTDFNFYDYNENCDGRSKDSAYNLGIINKSQESVKTFTASQNSLNDVEVNTESQHSVQSFAAESQNSNSSRGNRFTDSSESSSSNYEQLIFLENSFEIILLVDTKETPGLKNMGLSEAIKELTALGTKFEVRHLKVGDYVWICRNSKGEELLLPYIVERKRMDDLAGSIKDGRFHEQKFRLKQCGLSNVIYLVEKYGTSNLGLPIKTLQQATVNTQVVDEFIVKIVNDLQSAMLYLSTLTTLFRSIFLAKTLISCPKKDIPIFHINQDLVSLLTFKEFSKSSVKNKNFKVREMFIKQLLQIKGLSVDKALAIVNLYETPRQLMNALQNPEDAENLLSNVKCGKSQRKLGPVVSKIVYQLYTNIQLK